MSKNSWLLVATLIALALIAFFGVQFAGRVSPAPAAAAAPTVEPPAQAGLPRTITVVGEGKVTSKPDVATAIVGVEVTAATVKEATSETSSRMDKILAALKTLGIAEKDIQTSNYSINFESRLPAEMPAVEQGKKTPEQPGVYHVSNMVNLKIRDLTKVSQVLDEVVDAGANSIWGVNFTLDDTSKIQAEARAKAVADARARAEELARLSNVKLGQIVEVSEIIGGYPFTSRYGLEAARAVGGGGAGPVLPGELEMTMQVQVTFAIE